MKRAIVFTVVSCLLLPLNADNCDLNIESPTIIPEYHLPDIYWYESFFCKKRNRFLEELCDPAPVRNRTVQMICSENAGRFNIGQVCDVFDFLQANWVHLSDPYRSEFFADANTSLSHYRGDCDDFSIALATAIRSIGGLCRIVAAYHVEGGHAYAQLGIGSTSLLEIDRYLMARYPENDPGFEYCVQTDEWGNRWLNLDGRHLTPGGALFKSQSGYAFILGHPEYCLDLE